jgi:hypothetical protein
MDELVLALFEKLEKRIRDVDLRQGGPRGPKGRKGDKGDVGPKGSTGTQGTRGPEGTRGKEGPQGPVGARGPKGDSVVGPQGERGSEGIQGPQGAIGPKGDQGVSVQDANIDFDGNLTMYMSDGTTIDAGYLNFDQDTGTIVYNAGGGIPDQYKKDLEDVIEDLNDHLNDFNNPHQTSLANLIDTDLVSNDPLREGQGLWYDADTGLWKNRGVLAESFPTGLIDGGELNIGPGVNDIEVLAGFGLLADSYTDPLSPSVATGLQWEQINTPITAAPAVAGSIVWFSIAETATPADPPEVGGVPLVVGTLKQYAQPPSPPLARAELFLGVAVHNGSEWLEVSNPKVVNQAAETLREFVTTVSGLSRIISGGVVSEQPSFTLNQEEGVIWEQNRNWHNNKADPNREVLPAATPISFRYVTRDFGDVEALSTTVDPSRYDNGSGAPVNVPGGGNTATIQRLYLDAANNYWILWGQKTYADFQVAEANLLAYTPEVPFLLQNSIFLGSIVSETGKNDWDVDEALFIANGASGAGSGGGGTPITEYINLSDTPATYALDKRKVATVNELESAIEHDYRTKTTSYVPGNEYYPQEMVYSEGWLMVANTVTTDVPAPQPVGDPSFALPDSPAFLEPSSTSVVTSGHLYTFTKSGYFRGGRIWVPETGPDITYRVSVVRNPNSANPNYSTIDSPLVAAGQWTTLVADTVLVLAGEELLVQLESLNSGGTTLVTGGWQRAANSNSDAQDPTTSNWGTNNANTSLRINDTDLDTTDRSTELAGVIPGSTVQIVDTVEPQKSLTYLIQTAPVDQGTHFSWTVSLTNTGVSGAPAVGDTTTINIDVPVPQQTKYVESQDYWLTGQPDWATVTGYLEFSGVTAGAPPNDAYGVDIAFQELTKSDDWDIYGLPSGGGGGGGGDFTPTIFAGAGTTGYVPDPVTEDGKYLRDDGTWTNTIDGGTF